MGDGPPVRRTQSSPMGLIMLVMLIAAFFVILPVISGFFYIPAFFFMAAPIGVLIIILAAGTRTDRPIVLASRRRGSPIVWFFLVMVLSAMFIFVLVTENYLAALVVMTALGMLVPIALIMAIIKLASSRSSWATIEPTRRIDRRALERYYRPDVTGEPSDDDP